jgi:hypothetical protein
MSTCGLLFQWDSIITLQLSVLVYYKIIIGIVIQILRVLVMTINVACSVGKQQISVLYIRLLIQYPNVLSLDLIYVH